MAVTWNPDDKGAYCQLSNGNLTFQGLAFTEDSVRATKGVSSGKYFWELKISNYSTGNIAFGVGNASASLSQRPGINGNSWGIYDSVLNKAHNSSFSSYMSLTPSTGDVFGLALNMDDGELTVYYNGVSQGVAFTGITGNIFPMIGQADGLSTYVANFGATAFDYPIPSGYSVITDSTTYNDTLTESATTGDSITPSLVISSSTSDAVTSGDSYISTFQISESLSSSVVSADSLTTALQSSNLLGESVVSGDGLLGGVSLSGSVSDSISTNELYSVGLSYSGSLAEVISAVVTESTTSSPKFYVYTSRGWVVCTVRAWRGEWVGALKVYNGDWI